MVAVLCLLFLKSSRGSSRKVQQGSTWTDSEEYKMYFQLHKSLLHNFLLCVSQIDICSFWAVLTFV